MSNSLKGIDPGNLNAWLANTLPELKAPFTYEHLSGGHSNLSYRIDDAQGQRLVLRRPPLGKLPAKAHDVTREYRICSALQSSDVPVPVTRAVCKDLTVIGAQFYIMDFIDGIVPDMPELVEQAFTSFEHRKAAAENLVSALVALHKTDVDKVGLGELGPRNDYLSRQLKRMIGVWENTKTRELPVIYSLHKRLIELQPAQHHTGLVHSDYRLGNLMFNRAGQLLGVLDWELCAIGDVLVDLGFLLNSWDSPDEPAPGVWMQDAPTRAGGFPDRDWITERYTELSGFDISAINYYQAFCYWRIAIIGEGIKRRYLTGAIGSEMDPDYVEARIQGRIALAQHHLDR